MSLYNLRWSNIVTVAVAVLDIFHVKKYDLDFDTSRSSNVKYDGANRKPVGPTYKCSLGVQPRIYHRFRDISSQNFDVDLLALVGLTPEPKFTKRRDDLLSTEIYHPAKFHRPASTHAGDIAYKNILRTDKQKQ